MAIRPNILLILADDMGYGDFGMFNRGASHTPVLNQLVNESVCLTQHYSASPVCSPARAGLLTGRYPHRTGALTPQEVLGYDRIALDERTLADHLQRAGYATGLVGKWHNGALDARYHPNARGFAEFTGFCGGWADYYDWRLDENGRVRKSDGRYLTDVLTDEAIGFVRRHSRESFFLAVMYNAPHTPLQAPEDLVRRYQEAGFNRGVAIIYAMIQVMDAGIGRLMAALDEDGLAENTIVLISSDNGPMFRARPDTVPPGVENDFHRFNCGFNGAKGSVYEGGIRVPMLVRWPVKLPGGKAVDHLIHFTDWMPTLLAQAGVVPDGGRPLDGQDVFPLLLGEAPPTEPRRFWQWNHYAPIGASNAAMRDGEWKLVRPVIDGIRPATDADARLMEEYVRLDVAMKYRPEEVPAMRTDLEPRRIVPEAPPPELYNIRTDPQEAHNVAAQEPERARRMLAELETWFERVEADRMRRSA